MSRPYATPHDRPPVIREGERERNWFFDLASAAGLDYYYQFRAPAGGDAHSGDPFADAGLLRRKLALKLGRA